MLEYAEDQGAPKRRSFSNDAEGRQAMVRQLKAQAKAAGGARIVFAYEAGPHGFGLTDALEPEGIDCRVLAPTHLPQSASSRKQKTDEKDALRIFEALRGHLLAGNELPEVWVPDPTTRDDREPVRARLDVGQKATRTRNQIRMLLKRHSVTPPPEVGERWTLKHLAWLRGLTRAGSPLKEGTQAALGSLLRQWEALEREAESLEGAIERLADQPRYRAQADALDAMVGVGVFGAMVFLTEMGDLRRFPNRRDVGAYFGLAPRSHETGKRTDCKGPITRLGPARLRQVLSQIAWTRVRLDPKEKEVYARIVKKNPKKKKIALVACMRRTGIEMWHVALTAQAPETATPPSRSPEGGKRQFALPAMPRKYRRPSETEERRLAV
jgi:transposase